jgi:hypothetical protein
MANASIQVNLPSEEFYLPDLIKHQVNNILQIKTGTYPVFLFVIFIYYFSCPNQLEASHYVGT